MSGNKIFDIGDHIDCDVLIIGAGPAGASLACYHSSQNLKIILIEKKSAIDTPVRCAELVPLKVGSLFEFKIAGINNSIDYMDTYAQSCFGPLPGQKFSYRRIGSIKAPAFMLDRNIFIGDLVRRYEKNGGIFFKSCKIVSIGNCRITYCKGIQNPFLQSFSDDGNILMKAAIQMGGANKKYRYLNLNAKIVVGADGPLSLAGRIMGSVNKRFMAGFLKKIENKMHLACSTESNTVNFYFSPVIENGYGWLFPKTDCINTGIGLASESAINLKSAFELFRDTLSPAVFFKKGPDKKTNAITGLIPVSGMLPQLCVKNFILIGDAAGLCNPITGAGIYNAIYSAKLASGIILKSLKKNEINVLQDINQIFGAEFGPSLGRALQKKVYQVKNWPADLSGRFDEKKFEGLIKSTWPAFKEYYKN